MILSRILRHRVVQLLTIVIYVIIFDKQYVRYIEQKELVKWKSYLERGKETVLRYTMGFSPSEMWAAHYDYVGCLKACDRYLTKTWWVAHKIQWGCSQIYNEPSTQ